MFRESIRLFLCGLCMGTADAIPGISGGTVAFVMGFYDQLITSVKNPLRNWRFLLPLGIGMATAFLSLAGLIHSILTDPSKRVCFYGLFFGLILVSIFFCMKRVASWTPAKLLLAFLMAIPAYFLTVGLQEQTNQILPLWWLALSGFIAIGAMLLPGISGSYVMVIFGVYPGAMASLASIANNGLTLEPVIFLSTIGFGIIAGALCFTRGIELLLRHYHDATMVSLVGFMIGALPAVWPFWHTSTNAEGRLILEHPLPPSFDIISLIAICLMGLGFFAVLSLEKITEGKKA